MSQSSSDLAAIANAGNVLAKECYGASNRAGWWGAGDINERPGKETICTKLLLIVSEISEGMEGLRKDLKDDKLPARDMLAVELADAAIRIADLSGRLGYNLGDIIAEKMAYNAQRADHKLENRAAVGGKAF